MTAPADEARITMMEIKALNKLRASCKTAAERDDLDAKIADAKAAWWERTKGVFAAARVLQDAAFEKARNGPKQWDIPDAE